MATITPKQARINQLDANHAASFNALSTAPVSSAAHAAKLGVSPAVAVERLSLLVDQGLAVQARGSVVASDHKTYPGATLDSYTQAV